MTWSSWCGALATGIPSPCPTQGRFTIAAKHHISIAEIYETELVDIEKVRAGGDEQRGLQPVVWDLDSSLCPAPSGSPLVSEPRGRGVGAGRTWVRALAVSRGCR